MATVEKPPRSIFEPHKDYAKLLAGAHRRRVTTFGAPAAIRHLAFWNPPRLGPAEGTPAEWRTEGTAKALPVRKRTGNADRWVAAIYRELMRRSVLHPDAFRDIRTNSEIDDRGGKLIVLFGSVIDAGDGKPRKCPKRVRPDSYRAIKLSMLWHGIRTTFSFELHTEFLALTTILDASELRPREEMARMVAADPILRDFHGALWCLASVRSTDEARCRTVHEQLYHAIWEHVEDEVLAAGSGLVPRLGKKLVDFRGVVLGTKAGPKFDFSPPFARAPSDPGTGLERSADCNIGDFDSLWKFITCALPPETEFTLSRFLEDRAFYATALGVQPDVFVGSRFTPLYYLLFEDTLNPWQLGRLISRVHRAGTARIAAIMHFDVLRRASDILSRVESKLEQAIWEMSHFSDVKRYPDLRLSLRKYHAAVEAELAKISGLKLDGTLDSRIDRSRYYVNQFTRVVQALRIKRVSGFQPYDEFVNQRMGPVFEFIDSLGRVYARIQNDRASLQGRMQTLDSLHHEQLISEAQRIADIALSCALGPYYVGSVVAHALEGVVPERAVWLSATIFGMVMFLLIRTLRDPDELPAALAGPIRKHLAGRIRRFLLALAIAVPIAILLNGLLPRVEATTERHSAEGALSKQGGEAQAGVRDGASRTTIGEISV